MSTPENMEAGGRVERLRESFKDFKLLDKLNLVTVTLASAGLALHSVKLANDPDETISQIGVGYSLATTICFGTVLGLRLRSIKLAAAEHAADTKSSVEKYDQPKNTSSLLEYNFEAEDGTIHQSPFTVAVTGIHGEHLGTGRLMGGFMGDYDEEALMPVIEIQDPGVETGSVALTGSDCWWTPLDTELLDTLATKRVVDQTVPAGQYLQTLNSTDL
jgi:hypothetical protein